MTPGTPRTVKARVGAALLAVATVLGCAGVTAGCRARPDPPPAPHALPAPPADPAAVIGVWRATVNGAAEPTMLAFGPGGVLTTSDPGYGVWRARAGGAEGTWVIPIARLTITFVVVLRGETLIGTGVAATPEDPSAAFHPITLAGSRVKVDPAALGAVVPPRPS